MDPARQTIFAQGLEQLGDRVRRPQVGGQTAQQPRGKADRHLGVGHLAASPEGTRRRSKGHQEWWQPVVSGLAGRPPRSDATISSGDSATPIVLLERHTASQPGAAPAAGTRTTSGRCRWSSDPPHAGERTDQRLLAAGDLTRRIGGRRESWGVSRACQPGDTPSWVPSGGNDGWTKAPTVNAMGSM